MTDGDWRRALRGEYPLLVPDPATLATACLDEEYRLASVLSQLFVLRCQHVDAPPLTVRRERNYLSAVAA